MHPSRLLAIPAMVGMLVLTACADASAPQAQAPAGSSATPTNTTRTVGVASTSPAPNGGPTSSGTSAQPAREGDVDGDGRPDELTLTGRGVLKVDYSAGGSDTVKFTAVEFTPSRIVGVLDADRDGHAEVFVTFDQGASIISTTIFRYFDGHLHLMMLDADQVRLASGGSTGAVAGWACQPSAAPEAAIATLFGSSTKPNVYDVQLRFFTFAESRLVFLRSEDLGPTPLDRLPSLTDKTPGSARCNSNVLLADAH